MAALFGWAAFAGSAIVVATHDARVAEGFDRIWRLDHGRLTLPALERPS